MILLLRHGQTEWSAAHKHTGRTDLPLTDEGEAQARTAGEALAGRRFALVLCSPLQRAWRTCELAGYGGQAEAEDDLLEFDYGSVEGITTAEIRETQPGWSVWTHDFEGGEELSDVGARVDRVIERADAVEGDVLLVAHGHVLRVLTARWLGLEPAAGALFRLETARVGELGYERERRVLERWNA